LLRAAVKRSLSLAAGQHLQVNEDPALIEAEIDRLDLQEGGLFRVADSRHSLRQGATAIPWQGQAGVLVAEGPLQRLLPHLAIGALTHIGSHAALGFGRYDLAVYG
jgi:hypothetical protein